MRAQPVLQSRINARLPARATALKAVITSELKAVGGGLLGGRFLRPAWLDTHRF
jgi:hypothetical protein